MKGKSPLHSRKERESQPGASDSLPAGEMPDIQPGKSGSQQSGSRGREDKRKSAGRKPDRPRGRGGKTACQGNAIDWKERKWLPAVGVRASAGGRGGIDCHPGKWEGFSSGGFSQAKGLNAKCGWSFSWREVIAKWNLNLRRWGWVQGHPLMKFHNINVPASKDLYWTLLGKDVSMAICSSSVCYGKFC